MRTRIKICGITRPLDALSVVESGADAIGLVFHEASPRNVTIEQACSIVTVLPPFISIVALFVDASESVIRKVIEQVPVNLLQFHGAEQASDCELYGKPYMKAVHMSDGVDLAQIEQQYERASALLLDTHVPGQHGGTGQSFDWSLISSVSVPVILAGGLTPETVTGAVESVKPYAVDVSSGVESEIKGNKSATKINTFIQAVRLADHNLESKV